MRLKPARGSAFFPLIIALSVTFSACTSTTLIPVWRPWTRTVGDLESVQPAPYALRIEGEDHTTVGPPDLIEKRVGKIVEDLLASRGFDRADETLWKGDAGWRSEGKEEIFYEQYCENRWLSPRPLRTASGWRSPGTRVPGTRNTPTWTSSKPPRSARKIFITLEATGSGGYKVDHARIATEEEWSEYRTRLAGWPKALKEYYDVFE